MKQHWWKRKWFSIPVMAGLVFAAIWVACYLPIHQLSYTGKWAVWIQWGLPSVITGLMILSRLKKKRAFQGIEHGSAQWGTKKDRKPFIDEDFQNNIILSQTEFLSLNGRKTRRNCHVATIGGSGTGKSRNYVKPNVCQMNACYVLADPSGEHLASEGQMLTDNGYEIKIFNVYDFKKSMHFNPFSYYDSVADIRNFVDILMANTSGDTSNSQSNEDFWVKSERLWFMSHIAYMMETLSQSEINMNTLMQMLGASDAREDDEEYQNAIDILFEELERENPRSFAAKQYRNYKKAAGKTAKSILISIAVRMADFDITEVADLFADDELELDKLGKEKTALFLIMDETASTYNYMVAILIDTLINRLVRTAKEYPGMELPIPIRLILDEFINIGKFPKMSAWTRTLRKYRIGLEFIVQDSAGGKEKYGEQQWKSILGNCDSVLFLGSKEEDTTKFVSDLLVGDTTIEDVSYSGNGKSSSIGNSSYSEQQSNKGRKLLDPAEVGKMSNDECLVSIRGVPVFKSKKYDLTKHKNYPLLADGNTAGFLYEREELDLSAVQNVEYIDVSEETT